MAYRTKAACVLQAMGNMARSATMIERETSASVHELWRELLEPATTLPLLRAQAIVQRIYNEHIIDPDHRFHSKFFYEICPLVKIATHVGDNDTQIVISAPNDPYDGLLLFGNGNVQAIELTAAIDGHNKKLIIELLRERGSAPVYRKIEYTGTKRRRRFGPNEAEAVEMDVRDQELLERMQERLREKQRRARTNRAYREAWLGVAFDDWPPGHDPARWDKVCRKFLGAGPMEYTPFRRFFCVGIHQSYLFDSSHVGT